MTHSDPAGQKDPDEGTRARALAVSELFRRHNRTLVRFLSARLRDEQEARDLAQEAYVRLLELERTGAVSFLRAYLFRIAFNLAMDRLRARRHRRKMDATKLQPVEDALGQALVEQDVFAADELQVFWASLEELPPHFREAFTMSRLEGLPAVEIGRRLGRSERMIQRQIVQALVYCRHRVKGLTAEQAKEALGHE